MQTLLMWIGRVAGLAGFALCAVAFVARATNTWNLGSYNIGAILQAGVAGMLLGCLAYAAYLAERTPR
jgi:hypothetical protein